MPIVTTTSEFRMPGTWLLKTVGQADQTGQTTTSWDYKSSTGLKRARPSGFKKPTDRTASYRWGNWTACRNGFVHARNKNNGLNRTLTGALTFNNQWSNVSVASIVDASATDRAILSVRQRIKEQKVNLGVAFLERKQTASLFRSVTKTLGDAISAAKSHDWRRLKRVLKVDPRITKREKAAIQQFGRSTKKAEHRRKLASELWLANAYGIKPALSDIKGAAEALAEHDSQTPDRYRLKATGSACVNKDRKSSQTADTGISSGSPATISRIHEEKHCAKEIIHCYMENPALAQAASLGLTNPATWIWEKTPWSFVVDWLLPIGAYLDAMDATLGWKFLAGSVTTRVKAEIKQSAAYPNTSDANYDQKQCSAYGQFGYKEIRRTARATFPFPASILNLIKNPLSTGHVLNALALKGSRYR